MGLLRLKKLCERFSIDFKTAQNGFRDFIDDGGSRRPMSEELVELKGAVETIPVTSADAELGFSTMNVICSSLQNWLVVQRVSNLLFISLVGPSLEDFNALPYVKKWLASGAFETQSRKFHCSHMRKIFT